jgi:peptide deformylase
MEIVRFPHPALRFKSTDVSRIDEPFRAVVREMFELMYAARGVGLAANQVGIPLRFFVFNATGEREAADQEHVFVNPVIRNRKGSIVGEEGCLSLPGLFGDVRRAEEIIVECFDLSGQPVRTTLTELPARVVQHEYDHIDGVLFLDRVSQERLGELRAEVEAFEHDFRARQQLGEIPPDEAILDRLRSIAASGQLLSSV